MSLFQRLATIDKNNQTEIIVIPWKLIRSLVKLYANKCYQIYENKYLCKQIKTVQSKIIPINEPLLLAYPLYENSTLISCNYPVLIEYDKKRINFKGTQIIEKNNIRIQGHTLEIDLGELKQSDLISPIILKNDQIHFETLKNIDMSAIDVPVYRRIGLEFQLFVVY